MYTISERSYDYSTLSLRERLIRHLLRLADFCSITFGPKRV